MRVYVGKRYASLDGGGASMMLAWLMIFAVLLTVGISVVITDRT
jgi:hypothetical protein